MSEPLLTTEALAERWHVPKKRIWHWLSTGAELPRSLKVGSQRLFRLSAVEAFEETQERETTI